MLQGLKTNAAIRQSDSTPWECMVWRDDEHQLIQMANALSAYPSRYISIVGPPQVGKSTLVAQLQSRFDHGHVPYLFIYFDLLQLNPTAELQRCLAELHSFASEQIAEQLQQAVESSQRLFFQSDPATPNNATSKLDDILLSLTESVPTTHRIVLVLENVDAGNTKFGDQLLISLREISDRRINSELRRFTVITTSTERLDIDHRGIRSPFNVAEIVELSDVTKEDVEKFISKIESINEVSFDKDAVDFLYLLTGGVLSICHDVLSEIESTVKLVTRQNIMSAAAAYVSSPSRLYRLVLNRQNLNEASTDLINLLLCNMPVLAHLSSPGVSDLLRLGIVKTNSANRCEFRCTLLKWIVSNIYTRKPSAYPPTVLETILVQLPIVRFLVLDVRLRNRVEKLLQEKLYRESAPTRMNKSLEFAINVLTGLNIDIDWEFMHFLVSRFWDTNDGPVPSAEEVKVVAIRLAAIYYTTQSQSAEI